MALNKEIEIARQVIKTDAYSMSIGELMNLYQNDELDIHPEFQRFFRWSLFQKVQFIESIILGIPIPPIFVSQNDEGVWDVVDGLQRLSTIFEFAGILKDEDENLLPPLVLQGTKYLPSLQNKKWEDGDDPENSFTSAQRLFVKRSKFDVSIMLRESDDKAKYELFQRLNTGGSLLSAQEVRNCIIVMINRDFFFWLKNLATYESFQECVTLTDKALSEQYDLELVLRFVLFRQMTEEELSEIKDVGEFVTEKMMSVLSDQDIDYEAEESVFKATFDYIFSSLENSAFRRYVPSKEKFYGGFLLSAFEVIAFGVGFNDGNIDYEHEDFINQVKELWANPDFTNWSGSGVRASSRLPRLLTLGRQLFAQ